LQKIKKRMRRWYWLFLLAFIVSAPAYAVTGVWGHNVFYLPDAQQQQIS